MSHYERNNEIVEHLVYTDASSQELDNLLSGNKTIIIRGAAGRKLPYGRVLPNEKLYFIENNGSGFIKASGVVKNVFNSLPMTDTESIALIESNKAALQLTPAQQKRWAGKKYLVLIEVKDVQKIDPLKINRTSNMDDWVIVNNISEIVSSANNI